MLARGVSFSFCNSSTDGHVTAACSSCEDNMGIFYAVKSNDDINSITASPLGRARIADMIRTYPSQHFGGKELNVGILPVTVTEILDDEPADIERFCVSFYRFGLLSLRLHLMYTHAHSFIDFS
jgi:hypothetical protein